jgi:GH25 family lysozyme M1 (1,4-beta-N-acetylmuramidase)
LGAGSGGRLILSLIALAVLMASGAASITMISPGPGHPGGGEPTRQPPMLGSALTGPRSTGKASPSAPYGSPSPAARTARAPERRLQSAGSAAGRFNVGSTHSPELLRQLAGPLGQTGQPASAGPAELAPPASGAAGKTTGLPEGVDVAAVQHPDGAAIDWSRVAAAGYAFAAIKSTEGDYYANPYYASDLAAAKAVGLYVTGYHFAIPNLSPGAAQARYAVTHGSYTADGRTLPLELDVEYDPYVSADHTNECYGLSPTRMVTWISAFDNEALRLTGQLPIIYTTAGWWNTCTGDSTAFGSDHLWLAAYAALAPPLPAGWSGWSCWQYTSGGTVPGITPAGDTDVSYFDTALVTLIDPGHQRDKPGTAVSLHVNSLNATAGPPLSFSASGLPRGLSISGMGGITGRVSADWGTHLVTVTATARSGATSSVSFAWDVPRGYTPGRPSHR